MTRVLQEISISNSAVSVSVLGRLGEGLRSVLALLSASMGVSARSFQASNLDKFHMMGWLRWFMQVSIGVIGLQAILVSDGYGWSRRCIPWCHERWHLQFEGDLFAGGDWLTSDWQDWAHAVHPTPSELLTLGAVLATFLLFKASCIYEPLESGTSSADSRLHPQQSSSMNWLLEVMRIFIMELHLPT